MQLFVRMDVFGQLCSQFPLIFSLSNVEGSEPAIVSFSIRWSSTKTIIFCELHFHFTLLCHRTAQKIHRGVLSEDHLSTHNEKKLNWDFCRMKREQLHRTSTRNPQTISFWEIFTRLLCRLLRGYHTQYVWQSSSLSMEELLREM